MHGPIRIRAVLSSILGILDPFININTDRPAS